MDYEKPPIGVSPYWYVQQRRIKDLSEAIIRYAEYKLFDEQFDELEDVAKNAIRALRECFNTIGI